jgi:RNA recognition motif-containing protein
MSIYVGNLSYEVTQEDLTQAFTEYGTVKRVNFQLIGKLVVCAVLPS